MNWAAWILLFLYLFALAISVVLQGQNKGRWSTGDIFAHFVMLLLFLFAMEIVHF